MYTTKRHLLVAGLKIFDIAMMLIALATSLWIWGTLEGQIVSVQDFLEMKIKLENFIALLAFVPIYHGIFLSMRLYDSRRLHAGKGEWKDICKAVLIGTMILLAITVLFQRDKVSKEVLLIFGILACVLTCLGRTLMRATLGRVRRRNRNLRNILLVGWNRRAYDFATRVLAKPQLGYCVVGFIDEPSNNGDYKRRFELYLEYLGTLQDFDEVVERRRIDEVVISLPIRSFYEQIGQLIDTCETQGLEVHLLSNFFEMRIARAQSTEFDGIPILTLKTGSFSIGQSYVKRGFDLIVASALVILLSPLFLATALLIKILSPGPIFFVQTRVGYNRRRFKMIKFRTMVPEAERLQQELEELNEAQGPVFKMKDDPRITLIGRLLRKTSIDELPQLFNVIKGDMSLVGPRPLPLRDVMRFEENYLKRRFSVKPGITCLWQINGRSNSSFDEWIRQDLDYIDHWSFGLDLKILVKTIPVVFRGVGAY